MKKSAACLLMVIAGIWKQEIRNGFLLFLSGCREKEAEGFAPPWQKPAGEVPGGQSGHWLSNRVCISISRGQLLVAAGVRKMLRCALVMSTSSEPMLLTI